MLLSLVDYLGTGIDIWIALMLSMQSIILYKLLPQIRGIHANSNVFGIFQKRDKINEV